MDARGEGAEAAALAAHRARDVDVLEVEEEDVGDVSVAGEGRGAGHLALGGDVVPAGRPQLRDPRRLARDDLAIEWSLSILYVDTSGELLLELCELHDPFKGLHIVYKEEEATTPSLPGNSLHKCHNSSSRRLLPTPYSLLLLDILGIITS